MGTNYYLRKPEGETCEHCGRADRYEELHIGKSSAGWKFCFDNWYKEIPSFDAWKEILNKYPDKIFNEYNERITVKELIELIEAKQKGGRSEIDSSHEYEDKDGYRFSTSSEFC
jgi:hypothetical protein